jgi:GT2 family glycosyltransferase
MITIIYSTHKDKTYNENFKQHLTKTVGVKNFEVLEFENFGQYSLSEVYNKGVSQSKNNIIVCLHNDVKLETGWGKKLLKDFESNPEYGIIGKAGSCYFPESGIYWEKMMETMVGQVYHHPKGANKWLSKYSPKVPFLIPVVTIDGLFISFDKTKCNYMFDETIGKFHFYDHLFCIPNYLSGVKIGVTSSFEITHESVGQPNQEFWESKDKFIEKWGSKLPLDLKPTDLYVEGQKEMVFKNFKKIAVIIPTKSKLDLLFNCLDSYINHCNKTQYDLFIADTGSSEDEKLLIREFISKNNDKITITLLEYDYYNFAKINNDVVKNHINNDYEFLLFSNNDIVLQNNTIQSMLKVFKEKPRVGTVGARLYFENKTIQHNGIMFLLKQPEGTLHISHLGLRSYYNYSTNVTQVIGSTGALLMIRKNMFEKCGMFNENYTTCFEDVELNLKCILLGFDNYLDGKSVAYHLESQTRKENEDDLKKLNEDYKNFLHPFVRNNFEKLKKFVLITQ